MKRRLPRRLKRTGADPAFLSDVRRLPCRMHSVLCYGRIHAHHAGERPGIAMKAPDNTAIPLCETHHREWHAATGMFFGWTKLLRRYWADEAIEWTRAAVAVNQIVRANGNRQTVSTQRSK